MILSVTSTHGGASGLRLLHRSASSTPALPWFGLPHGGVWASHPSCCGGVSGLRQPSGGSRLSLRSPCCGGVSISRPALPWGGASRACGSISTPRLPPCGIISGPICQLVTASRPPVYSPCGGTSAARLPPSWQVATHALMLYSGRPGRCPL